VTEEKGDITRNLYAPSLFVSLFAIKITSWNPMPDDGLFIGVSGTDGLGGVGKAGVLDRC